MKVNTISATLKYSRQLQDGEWKGIEVGAEASVNSKEDWKAAQKTLYEELAGQLATLFNNSSQKVPQKPSEEPTDSSWCPIHKVKMKRREKDGGVWYSHKTKDGWCRGQAQRKGARK